MDLLAAIERPAAVVAGKAGPATTVATDVRLAIWAPRGSEVQTLADLGGGRASQLGRMPWGTDVRPGDILTQGAATWHVRGVDASALTQVLLALSQQVGG